MFDIARQTLHRYGLLTTGIVASYRARNNGVEVSVGGRINLGDKVYLRIILDLTSEGVIKLAYDAMTGEVLVFTAMDKNNRITKGRKKNKRIKRRRAFATRDPRYPTAI